MIRKSSPYIKLWLARSKFEESYINKAYSVPNDKIAIVPLSFRIPICKEYPVKEVFYRKGYKKYILRRYQRKDVVFLYNYLRCEAHRDLLLQGLKDKLEENQNEN